MAPNYRNDKPKFLRVPSGRGCLPFPDSLIKKIVTETCMSKVSVRFWALNKLTLLYMRLLSSGMSPIDVNRLGSMNKHITLISIMHSHKEVVAIFYETKTMFTKSCYFHFPKKKKVQIPSV